MPGELKRHFPHALYINLDRRTDRRQRFLQVEVVFQSRTSLSESIEQSCFRLLPGRFDIDRNHVVGQAWQQTRFDER